MRAGCLVGLLALIASVSVSCRSRGFHPASGVASRQGCSAGSWRRDWQKDQALFVRERFEGRLFVLGDVHGTLGNTIELLGRAGVAQGSPESPEWIAGRDILVLVGDLIDKGGASLPVLRYFMGLEKEAERAGGAVVVVPGNHEIAFLTDPYNSKAKEFVDEIEEARMDVCKDVYSSNSAIGQWLRRRPMAAIVNGMFISHTGYTYEQTLSEMEEHYREMVNEEKWTKKFSCGDASGGRKKQGFFNARAWWAPNSGAFHAQLDSLRVRQIVFGHDPGAFEAKGRMRGKLWDDQGTALIKVDVGLQQGDSRGEILKCEEWKSNGACASPLFLRNPERSSDSDRGFEPLRMDREAPPENKPEDATGEC